MSYTCTIPNLASTINALPANTRETPYEVVLTEVTYEQCFGYGRTQETSQLAAALWSLQRFITLQFDFVSCLSTESFYLYRGYESHPIEKVVALTVSDQNNSYSYAGNYVDRSLAISGLDRLVLGGSCSDAVMYNGDIYNTGRTELIRVNELSSKTVYTVYESVTSILTTAFSQTGIANNLVRVDFGRTLNQWSQIVFESPSANPLSNGISELFCQGLSVSGTASITGNTIADYAFCNYMKITSLSFSGSSIGRYALSGCANLESVTLTGSLTDLSHRFENLTGLRSVTGIPSTVTDMTSCFSGCTSLETIRKWSADTDNVTMTGCFTDCGSLTAVYVDYPAVSPSGCGWKYCEASLTASAVALSIYDSSQSARTGARTKTVTYSGDKALELFNLVDELAAASAFTTAELDTFMQYKYPLTIDGEGYLSPSGDNFVLWAKDDEKVLTNFSVEAKWTAALFDHIYPVGSIYMSATDSRNPGTIFGFGSWYKLAPGRVLMGEGANEANTDSTYGALNANTENRPAGEKGGQYTHALTQSEMPRHNHANSVNSKTLTFGWKDVVMDTVNSPTTSGTGSSVNAGRRERDWTGKSGNALRELKYSAGHDHGMTNAYTGGSGSASSASNGVAHSNMQPYLVVYMWYRYG